MNSDERIVALLEELVAWSRLSARKELLPLLETTLADDRHRLAFELTDGTRTQTQVAEEAGISQATVSGLWARWRRLGILRERGTKPVHIGRPSDYGLQVPSVGTDGSRLPRRGSRGSAAKGMKWPTSPPANSEQRESFNDVAG
jgi:hypothetical protein